MSKQLPPNPNLEYDKKQAKALLKAYRAQKPEAVERVKSFHPRLQHSYEQAIPAKDFTLSDAQLVIAREYGCSSWVQLKHLIEAIQNGFDTLGKHFIKAVQISDTDQVRNLLQTSPELVKRIDAPVIGFDSPAIVIAAGCKNRQLVDVLLEYGADINAKSAWWAGAFGALHGADAEMTEYLLERGAKFDVFSAAEQNRLDVLTSLIEVDPTLVHAKGPDGQRALHFARSTAVIDYLLEKGAEMDARDLDHCGTAAQWMLGEHPELCRYLIERGAEVDIFMVTRLGDIDRLKHLLDVEPNLVDKRIGQNDYPAVPLAPGHHIYIYSLGDNKSAHQIAVQYGHPKLHDLLLERSSTVRRFVAACERADTETIQAMLQVSTDLPHRLQPQDQRLLVDAAWENRLETVKLMLKAGFDPHIQSGDGSTALHSAAFHGFSELVKLLLEYNPPLELRNEYGARPLDSALYGTVHSWRHDGDFPATVDALLKAGSRLAPDAQPTGNAAVDALLAPYLNVKDA
jgi:ankyrin repeat protein